MYFSNITKEFSSSQQTLKSPTNFTQSDTIYLETASDPTGQGSVPQDCPNTGASCKSRLLPALLTSPRLEVSTIPSSGWSNLLERLVELREIFSFVYQFIVREAGEEQPNAEICRVGSRWPQEQELLSQWNWEAPPSWYMDVFMDLEVYQFLLFKTLYRT